MRISDCSSDVCSSDVHVPRLVIALEVDVDRGTEVRVGGRVVHEDVDGPEALHAALDRCRDLVGVACVRGDDVDVATECGGGLLEAGTLDRIEVCSGKSVSVRVDPGGGRGYKK